MGRGRNSGKAERQPPDRTVPEADGHDSSLVDEDLRLWSAITRSVEPLSKTKKNLVMRPELARGDYSIADPQPERAKPANPAGVGNKASDGSGVGRSLPERRNAEPKVEPTSLDRRQKRRLSRGQTPVDATLDLHGMRQREARTALKAFLIRAQAADHRFVRIITGKGRTSRPSEDAPFASEPERGVLRRMVPLWLEDPEFCKLAVGYSSAGRSDGGDGALYLQIRNRVRRSRE